MFINRKSQEAVGKRNWNYFDNTILLWLLAFGFWLLPMTSFAQCAMCRAALEGEGNKAQAQAVNDGIVYLMVIPYLLVAGIGYYIYRMRKMKK